MNAGAAASLPPNLEWYSEQIGGHHPSVIKNGEHQIGLIKEKGSELLLKPVQDGIRGQCEVAFYEWINELADQSGSEEVGKGDIGGKTDEIGENEEIKVKTDEIGRKTYENSEKLGENGGKTEETGEKTEKVGEKPVENSNFHLSQCTELVPKYYGLKTLSIGRKTIQCLIMEDLLNPYTLPCTMELKMGKVTFDPNASQAKRISEAVKYPAQQILGFRLVGYRMHCEVNQPPRVRDKLWGRSKNPENIVDAFGEFLSGRPGEEERLRLAEELISQLRLIRDWFMNQKMYHLYASSILIVYEADESKVARVCARLIDFAHVFPAEGKVDENFLFGVNNVIMFVEKFRERLVKVS